MTKVISRWWRWFRHLPLGNTELQNLENAYTWDLENYSIHLPILQHPKPNFVRQSFIFSLYQNQVCLHNEQEKFGRKQSAVLRLIKSITKLSNVIGYHQPDLSTYNIPKKITRVWLAENGCILYVTRVQMTSSAPKISVVTFLTGWQTILIMLVWRILYNYSATYALESFHN